MALLTNINGKFSVSDAGAVRFNDAFTFPTADGDANYVLKTNGSGQLAWGPDNDSGGDITGSGTANTVTKFTGAKVIGDGPITFATNDSTFAGTITASKNQNATSNFTFQNTDTTGTSVRTHLNATAGNRSIRLEAIHNDYSYVVSNNARIYLQTNSGSNNPLFLDGDNGTFAGDVTANANYTAGNSKIIYKAQRSGGAVAGDWSYDDATTDMSLGTSTAHSFSLKTGNTRALTINTSQNATFAKNLGVGGVLPSSNGGSGARLLGVHDGVGSGWSVTKYTNTTTGTAAADGSIFGIIGSDAYIFNYEAGKLFLATNSVNRLIIDSSGNVGIGMTPIDSLDSTLQVSEIGQTITSGGDIAGKSATFAGTGGVTNSSIVTIVSTNTSIGAQQGGEIGFAGKFQTGSNQFAQFAKIMSYKKDTTSGNYGGGLQFWTRENGTPTAVKMTIDPGGNVGIGVTTPSTKLHVSNAAVINDAYGLALVENTSTGTGSAANSALNVKSKYGTSQFMQWEDNGLRIGSRILDNSSAGNVYFTAGGDSVKMVMLAGGEVGIGTTSPTNGKLVVDSTANQIAIETGTAGDGRLNIGHFSNGTFIGTYGDDGGAADLIRFGTHSGDERMRITSAGNVGIGTDTLTEKLRVQGVSGSDLLVRFQPFTNNASSKLYLSSVSSGDGGYYYNSSNNTAGLFSYGDYTFNVGTANISGTIGNPRMVILQGGNVGIGTTSPGNKLTIASGTGGGSAPDSRTLLHIDKNGEAYISINSPAESFNGIRLNVAGTPKAFMELYDNTAQGKKLNIGTVDARDLVFDTGNQPKMVILAGGNVGIGNVAPSYKLDVDGTIRATGDVIAYSDVRVKENIKTIDNSLEKVNKLRGVEFNKIGEDEKSIGVIAQEIEKVIPEVVREDEKGMKSVAYGNISGLLIEAIKELKAEIEELKLNKCNCNK